MTNKSPTRAEEDILITEENKLKREGVSQELNEDKPTKSHEACQAAENISKPSIQEKESLNLPKLVERTTENLPEQENETIANIKPEQQEDIIIEPTKNEPQEISAEEQENLNPNLHKPLTQQKTTKKEKAETNVSEATEEEGPKKRGRGRKPSTKEKVKKSISPPRTRSQDRSLRDKKKVHEKAPEMLGKKTTRRKKT